MRWAAAAAAAVAASACYAPALPAGSPCDPARSSCPNEQTCVPTGGGAGVCMAMGRTVDAGSDSAPVGKGPCLGGKLLGSVCLAQAPTGPVSLGGSQPLNTAAVGAGGCTEIQPQTGGPSLCIVAGTTIEIPASASLRAIALVPAGSTTPSTNPLVLFATQSITISGALDVSSHVNETFGGTPGLGAGARTEVGCLAAGVDGPVGSNMAGGGGAAGGSFAGAGAAGGNGGNNNNIGHGNPAAPLATNVLVGGCPGGHGGDGDGNNGGGAPGGGGGGAVYLLAGDAISITGKIDASGSGGGGGGAGGQSSGGGGGGGAGGMIGLEATHIAVMTAAALFANGGGGGAGGGNAADNTAGTPGADPSAPGAAAAGGAGTSGGGAGGAGAFGTTAPTAGVKGSGNQPESAGGGGGGGVGAIKVFAAQTPSLAGQISPPPG